MKPLCSQRGAALIIVLMIVALVSVLATDMGTRLQLQVQRASNIKDNNQAYWYAIGAEEFARSSLATLMKESGDTIHLNQPWSQQFVYPLDNGGIEATLEDMHSCFNLNALTGTDNADGQAQQSGSNVTESMAAFRRLLIAVAPDKIDSYSADTVRDSLTDWLDADDQMRAYGAEDSEYSSREFPYLAANSGMVSQSELRLINGVEPSWLAEVLPVVCVIPGVDTLKINVNTLDENHAGVLAGTTGLAIDQAKSVIASRPQDGWNSADDFLAEPDIQALQLSATQREWFTVTTAHFILHTKTRYNNATFAMATVFNAQSDSRITVLRREFGVLK